MSLSAGTRLGPYEIVGALGAGGMGEVYRAQDTRLGRDVALKVLHSSLAATPDLKGRFEREARAISQLNHPNICTLHDIGRDETSNTDFLVMELIDGESLADRLRHGPLPVEALLKIGCEIADALGRAHRAGIIHRDLKPANIMLTKAGAKLLDFGLAKPAVMGAVAGSGSAPLLSAAMTSPSPHASPVTMAGSIVGTVQYMSPEQIEGKEADARSDIFAFGAVLYEMATGKRAFEGKSQLTVASSILEKEPQPVSEVLSGAVATTAMASSSAGAVALLERVIADCLAKSPEERYQSAHDVKLDLAAVAGVASRLGSPTNIAQAKAPNSGRWVAAVLAALLVLALAALALVLLRHTEVPVVRAAVTMDKGVEVFPFDMAFSPDGMTLALVARTSTSQALWLRPIGSSQARVLAGTEDARYPFWAPDGRRIGFFAGGKLKITDPASGSVIALADAPDGRGGTWCNDDTIIYAPNLIGPLWRVPAAGGAAVQQTELTVANQESGHRWPLVLPDGKHLLFFVVGPRSTGMPSQDPTDKVTGIYSFDLQTKAKKLLAPSDSGAAYVPGYLLYYYRQNLMAQPFDAASVQFKGAAVGLAQERVGYDGDRWGAAFAAAANGLLAYVNSNVGNAQLAWLDRAGKSPVIVGTPDFVPTYPALSPDGKRLAVTRPTGQQEDIWIIDLERGTQSRLTFDNGSYGAVWSPDGKRIAYSSTRGQVSKVFIKDANGMGDEQEVLLPGAADATAVTDWSPDGAAIVTQSAVLTQRNRLFVHWMVPGHKDGWLLPASTRGIAWREATFSPDGKWLSYSSDESGRWEIYVVPFPQVDGKFQVSTNGGMQPRWRRDGKEMYFIGLDRKLYAVAVHTQSNFHAATPTELFADAQSFSLPTSTAQYDVAAAGDRFLILRRQFLEGGAEPITLVTNWTAELKQK